jgi:hypothetical protein
MIKATLAKAGKVTAWLYVSTLCLSILIFPLIFCGGLIYIAAMIVDGVGFGHFGIAGLLLFFGASFLALLFFSIFAWPHISPVVGKALAVLRLEAGL